jgi:hypothetical protein
MPAPRLAALAAMLLALACAGCAHSIRITPDMAAIEPRPGQVAGPVRVGYHFTPGQRALQVETPGGSGDKVSYAPYADIEPGLYQVLANLFAGVTVVKDPHDAADLRARNIRFVFLPVITTTSGSRNIVFWPPTDFTVTIACTAIDADGVQVWSRTVSANEGVVSVNATLHENGLAGRRAAGGALRALQAALSAAPELHP